MPSDEYRPRLSVDIPQHHYDALKQLVPFGLLKPLVGALVEDLVSVMLTLTPHERAGFMGALISRRMNLTHVLPTLREAKDGNDK